MVRKGKEMGWRVVNEKGEREGEGDGEKRRWER